MSFIGTQIFNNICTENDLGLEELELFKKNWQVINKIESPTQWHTEWRCNPLGKTFTLLRAPTGEGIFNPGGKYGYSYFSDKGFTNTAISQNKKIMEYDSKMFEHFISLLPKVSEYHKNSAYFLGKMFMGNILGTLVYPGYYSAEDKKWKNVGDEIDLRLTEVNQHDSKTTNRAHGKGRKMTLLCWRERNNKSLYQLVSRSFELYTPGIVYY